jgi:RNA polymerase sigma factor (sigma-70 family)
MRQLPLRQQLQLRDLHMREAQLTMGGGCEAFPAFTQTMSNHSLNTLLEHRSQFLGFVRRRVPDDAAAEDILQAAYARALQHEGELPKQESVVGWFYRVLRNAVIDKYRRRATEDRALESWSKEMEGQSAPSLEVRDAVCACLMPVMDEMRPEYARLLRAVDLGEQRLQDFAKANGISTANAAVRAHRARAALRKELIRTCGACAEHACIDCTCKRA